MEVSVRQLEILRREAELRRREVAELHLQVAKRTEEKQERLSQATKKQESFRQALLRKRLELSPAEISSYIKRAKKESRTSSRLQKDLGLLKKHSSKLTKQLTVMTKKMEYLQEKKDTRVREATAKRGELELEELLDAVRAGREKESKETGENVLLLDDQSSLDTNPFPFALSVSPQGQRGESFQQGQSMQQSSEQHSQPAGGDSQGSRGSRSGQGEATPSSSSNGSAYEHSQSSHHIRFSYELSSDEQIEVHVERRDENALSLAVTVQSGSNPESTIRSLKPRLASVLQRSGFTLKALRVVPIEEEGKR